MTVTQFYGLKENPFEPTGAAAGKYPFVPPANFRVLEDKIRQVVVERKLYVLLVSSPHGAGKSTVADELRKRAEEGAYADAHSATVILTRLANLSITDFVADVMEETRSLVRGGLQEGREVQSLLRKQLSGTIMRISEKTKLLLWIIDEFDILADRPETEQRDFLQFLRGVIDELAAKDLPIALLMSHTKYSSREFEVHLQQMHGPFQSRIVASLTLGYTFDEVREIVAKRLSYASETPRRSGDVTPFSESALQTLFSLVTSQRRMQVLDNFRIYERCCYFALLEGAKQRTPDISPDLMQRIFSEYGITKGSGETKGLSMKTQQLLVEMAKAPLLERNESILRGLIQGISRSRMLGGEVKIPVHETSYIDKLLDGRFEVSSLMATLEYRGKTVILNLLIASTESELVVHEDLERLVELIARHAKLQRAYAHVRILGYVSQVDAGEVSSAKFDRILWLSKALAEDLTGLGAGDEGDIPKLIESFDAKIAPHLSEFVSKEVRDITGPLSPIAVELVEALFVMHYSGEACTKEALRGFHKRLFTKPKMAQQRSVRELVQQGFALEQAAQLSPDVPKSLQRLIGDYLKSGTSTMEELSQHFGSITSSVVGIAQTFGYIVVENGGFGRRREADYETELGAILSLLREDLRSAEVEQSEPGQRIRWLIDALDKARKNRLLPETMILLTAVKELGPKLHAEVATIARVTLPQPGTASPLQAVETPAMHAAPARTETAVQIAPQATKDKRENMGGTIEKDVFEILRAQGPMTLGELEAQLGDRGHEGDVRTTILRLVMNGRLKVASAG